MVEKNIEKKLVKAVKERKGLCLKFVSPGMVGVPDRIVLLPKGKIAFVELKATGKKPRPVQVKRIDELKKLGFQCYIIDEERQIGGMLDEI